MSYVIFLILYRKRLVGLRAEEGVGRQLPQHLHSLANGLSRHFDVRGIALQWVMNSTDRHGVLPVLQAGAQKRLSAIAAYGQSHGR
ncbi:hypothetical protein DAA51_02345 [Bradyrhizobium sp. WBAH10]|nr:hypothetical protein [Bradyrhizobium sp. WBAH30]MDD1546266.1 hypothetical protein [Bradyrhizobium sp. WBAH41]MDD1559753.1 hypothetical protein [Bradyrhizobium sp. WBAH23]MDD1567561.1 hypothetical protein [Bradyrhizobium sp. WBAH33]MDD1593163.1 hypothetical protein [Bradyrhizobium sp. WBAH42]NRB90757.1 hypothetical protein [Bradyrhizobium sp. WBAH10]QCJ87676.1 hypothetical protein DAA57_03455 [Bradyrhizobium yuanmingense]